MDGMTQLSLGDALAPQTPGSLSHRLGAYSEAGAPLLPGGPSAEFVAAGLDPERSLVRHGGASDLSLLARGQGWEKICGAKGPETPSQSPSAVPLASAAGCEPTHALVLRHGGGRAPSLLGGQAWERLCSAAEPESPCHPDPAPPCAPATWQPPAGGAMVLDELLVMYKAKARALQPGSEDLAALAAAAGNAAAAAVLSGVQASAAVHLAPQLP